MKISMGVFAGGSIGLVTLANAFKTKKQPVEELQKLGYKPSESNWKYQHLNPDATAELAYTYYSEGSCMYATVRSVISQLAEKFGEPFVSFPYHMFKYGHGGVGGYGSVCGTLNGAAALIGLLITDKNIQDQMIADIFQWYENTPFPEFVPLRPAFDFELPASVSNSVLCHASNTNWCNKSGFKITSNERKERCRRMTGDVAKKVTTALNGIHAQECIPATPVKEADLSCLNCHGNEGKIKNTAVKMSCNSCHSESVGHRVFSDLHYKIMKE